MVVVYAQILNLHQTVSAFLTIQIDTKEKKTMLKKATININIIHDGNNKYPEALRNIPTKYQITTKNDKVHIHIKI